MNVKEINPNDLVSYILTKYQDRYLANLVLDLVDQERGKVETPSSKHYSEHVQSVYY